MTEKWHWVMKASIILHGYVIIMISSSGNYSGESLHRRNKLGKYRAISVSRRLWGVSKSGLKDNFMTVPEVVSYQMDTAYRKGRTLLQIFIRRLLPVKSKWLTFFKDKRFLEWK